MNGIFFVIFLLSSAVLLVTSPDGILSSMLAGGQKAIELTVTMTAVYAVWLGILRVAEECGVTAKLAKILKKPVLLIFGKVSDKACEHISMNLSANLLGMGGVATPMGIAAAKELDSADNRYAMGMLLVIASTSIQLLPTSVITLRAEAGSASPGDIILPTVIATAFSTVFGCICFHLAFRRKRR